MASDWREIGGNQSVFRHLHDVVSSRKSVAFVGAGASAGLYPLWKELISQLAKETFERGLANKDDADVWANKAKPQQAIQRVKETLGPGR